MPPDLEEPLLSPDVRRQHERRLRQLAEQLNRAGDPIAVAQTLERYLRGDGHVWAAAEIGELRPPTLQLIAEIGDAAGRCLLREPPVTDDRHVADREQTIRYLVLAAQRSGDPRDVVAGARFLARLPLIYGNAGPALLRAAVDLGRLARQHLNLAEDP